MPAYVNGAYSVVALAPSPNPATSTSMTLSVGDGVLFPDPASVGPYDISIWPSGAVYRGGSGSGHGEICTVTAKSVDTLTIVRGAQSSTARVVIAGDQVAYTVSAGIFANFTLLNGQAGGQELFGGIAASENLVLRSTTHATKGAIYLGTPGNDFSFNEVTGRLVGDRTFSGSTVSSSSIYIIERGTSDPRLGFEVFGVTAWETGIDNSDDDAYKIQNSTGFGDYNSTQGYLRIDRTSAVLINGQSNGISSLEIGQDVAGSYAHFRMRGRYVGASGAGIYDLEAVNNQIYLYDRSNSAFMQTWYTGGAVSIPGSLSIGAGASPFTGLDVETGVGATYGKFGGSLPVYIVAANPNIGFNAYYNGGWKFGKGSSAHHAADIAFDPIGGTLVFFVSTAPGAANGAVSFASPLLLTSAHAQLPLLTSTSVLATDSSGNIVAGTLAGDPNIITVPSGCSAATLQAAINSLGSLGGKIILPPGVYDFVSTEINLPAKNIYIQGSGRNNTIIKATGAAGHLFRFDAGITWTWALGHATMIEFSDITFHADSTTTQFCLYLTTPGMPANLIQPPMVMIKFMDCDFKMTDHTTNRGSALVYLSAITGVRFRGCSFYMDIASGANIYGLSVWIDGGTPSSTVGWVQDVRFTDCQWFFINGVYASGVGGDCEGIHFYNSHFVGQGRNIADAATNHFAITMINATDFQWHGGEITSVDGNPAVRIDSSGPCFIDNVYIDGIGSVLIDVQKNNANVIVFFSHLFTNDDGGGAHPIVFHGSASFGFFGTISDCYFIASASPCVSDPGSGGSALSFINYHNNYGHAGYYELNAAGVP